MIKIENKTFLDKIHGGWVGKSAGGILGAPVEGWKKFNEIPLGDDVFKKKYPNDDLDLQILWLDLAKQYGPTIREMALAEHWKNHVSFPWNEYGVALRNLKLGIYPPESGRHNNHYWQNSMGSPIRSEIWGMLNPGMPEQAAYYASMDSSIDHFDFSVDAESFLSACTSLAFIEHDFKEIFHLVRDIFDHESTFTELADYVYELFKRCSFENAVGKLKSRYGDADFTFAPLNVGFALLVLLYYEPDFNNLIHALHLGHDSDCICATVGSLWGVLIGYKALPQTWTNWVGDDLVISPEITGISAPTSLSDLSEQTLQAAIPFIEYFEVIELTDTELFRAPWELSFNMNFLMDYHPADLVDYQKLEIEYENLRMEPVHVHIEIVSKELEFNKAQFEFDLDILALQEFELEFKLKDEVMQKIFTQPDKTLKQAFQFLVNVQIDDEEPVQLLRSVPFYGVWLMLGPFVQDDETLAPMDEHYPDHGLSTMPSCRYMNHNKINTDTDFLDIKTIRNICQEMEFEKYPFPIEPIQPADNRITLNTFLRGRGEKTFYLYSKVYSKSNRKVWLSMGCSTYVKIWWNGQLIHQHENIRSTWPGDITLLVDLDKGENDILLKIDMATNHLDLECGFKEYVGKHPHQSQWDTELVPII